LNPVSQDPASPTDADQNLVALRGLYDSFNLSNVWAQLSTVLTMIHSREKAGHVANVMLPLIEAYMVVSKPYIQRTKAIDSAVLPNEEGFIQFTEQHKTLMNKMVRTTPSLMSGSFALLVHNPKGTLHTNQLTKVLEFDNKRTYFNQQLHKKSKRERHGVMYHQLQGRSGEDMKYSKLNVKFNDEEGVDVGGLTREWFSVLARQMFNPDYALFQPSAADKITYQPNRSSWINPDHIFYFRFIGRIIGKAVLLLYYHTNPRYTMDVFLMPTLPARSTSA